MSEEDLFNAPLPETEYCRCRTCGHVWKRGQDGSHSCSRTLLERVNRLEQKVEVLEAGIVCVRELINESEGVYGLHMNGDGAPWESLQDGGFFSDWLMPFNRAERAMQS